jgi:beta-lactamase regulating signal transducer with metallopeptidase domain
MLEIALRITLILTVAWTLTRLMPRATAATRHLVWHGALIATLIAPLAALAKVPQVPVVPKVPEVLSALPILELPPLESTPRTSGTPGTLGTVGTLAAGLWFAVGWRTAFRLSRRARPAPVAWQLELNALCERLRIDREVRLAVVDEPCSPLATGLWRHTILLPRIATEWADDRRRAVLQHEIAHIARGDLRTQLVVQAACALYWFNPFVWVAAAEIRRERERACDDQVLRLGASASSYASHLLAIARELRPSLQPQGGLAMARPSEMEGRLVAVLAAGRTRVPLRATRWAVPVVVTATTLAALSVTSAHEAAPHALVSSASPRFVAGLDALGADEAAPEPLAKSTERLQSSPDPHVREKAAMAVALTSGRDVVPTLVQALADPSAHVREKAAVGLALRRDARVVEPLLAALTDAEAHVREKAAIALGTTGDPRAHAALTRALHDPDAQVRDKAAAGLVLFSASR